MVEVQQGEVEDNGFGKLEEIRAAANLKKKRIHLIFSLIALVAVTLVITFFGFTGLIFAGVAVGGGWFFFINLENKKFAQQFKENVLVPSLLKRFPDLTYNTQGISKEHFLRSELFKKSRVDGNVSLDSFSLFLHLCHNAFYKK